MYYPLIKVAYIGQVDPIVKRLYRYGYLGRNILSSPKNSIASLIGADFSYYIQEESHFQIWEIDVKMKFEAIKNSYFRGCSAGIILFDLHKTESIEKLAEMADELWKQCGNGFIPIAFVGIRDIYKKIDSEVIEEYNTQISILKDRYSSQTLNLNFIESNIQHGENCKQIFSFFNYVFNSPVEDGYLHQLNIIPKTDIRIIENEFLNPKTIEKFQDNSELIVKQDKNNIRCIADKSLINIKDDDVHYCTVCSLFYCSSCFICYNTLENFSCPGSSIIGDIHEPNFSK